MKGGNNMIDIGSPIKSFIEQIRNQTKEGLGDWELKAPISLEISTIVNGNAEGLLDIKVINFGAKIRAEQVQKIKISIGPKSDLEQAENKLKLLKINKEEFIEKKRFEDTKDMHSIMKNIS